MPSTGCSSPDGRLLVGPPGPGAWGLPPTGLRPPGRSPPLRPRGSRQAGLADGLRRRGGGGREPRQGGTRESLTDPSLEDVEYRSLQAGAGIPPDSRKISRTRSLLQRVLLIMRPLCQGMGAMASLRGYVRRHHRYPHVAMMHTVSGNSTHGIRRGHTGLDCMMYGFRV